VDDMTCTGAGGADVSTGRKVFAVLATPNVSEMYVSKATNR